MHIPSVEVREIGAGEFELIWPIFRPVIEAGDTLAMDSRTSFDEARAVWAEPPSRSFAAFDGSEVVGTFMVRPWQTGRGDHVANAGYIVAPAHRRKGIARRMCMLSLEVAKSAGFSAMVFNYVVASNEGAVRLWEECGFRIVGRVPGAFRHAERGLVDTLVMHRIL